jgi:hypothetical protein
VSLGSRIDGLDDWYPSVLVPAPNLGGTFRAGDGVEGLVVGRHEELNAAVI